MTVFSVLIGLAASVPALAKDRPRTQDSTLELVHPSGTVVTARIRAPEPASARRLPAVMVFGGFQEAAYVLESVESTRPVVVASFDYPYSGRRRLTFIEAVREAGNLRKMAREVTPLIESLTAKLKERPDVDPERIVLIGASFGAPFAIYAAARGVGRYLVLIHGFADVVGTLEYRLHRIFSEKGVPGEWVRRSLAWSLARLIWIFLGLPRVEDEAKKLGEKQFVLSIEATLDRMVAESSRVKLRESLRASAARVEFVAMPSGHLQGVDDRLLNEILPTVESWLVRNGAFL